MQMLKIILVLLILAAVATPAVVSYIYGDYSELDKYFDSALEFMSSPAFIIAVLLLAVFFVFAMRATHLSRKTTMEKRKLLKKKVLGK